ncbi:MAG: penicillin-binding protein 2 [Gammaproteobacteria bacterium]|nr:penicillin-binding protein 2 [Gammaproteobacteria bacterium]
MSSTIKDHIRESRAFNERAAIILGLVVTATLILFIRLFYLQIISYEHFITLAENNRVAIIPTPPTRGLIYDRNGVLLAQNTPSFSLDIIPERVTDLKLTISELTKIISISAEDLTRFNKELKQKKPFMSISLRYNLNEDEVATFAIHRYRFPGVEVEAQLIRHYPFGGLASHTVGYVSRLDEEDLKVLDAPNYRATRFIGKAGIEKFYEGVLHGTTGYNHAETNAAGRSLQILKRDLPTPGQNLYLTVDSRLQQIAETAMGGFRGGVIAIDPRNGDVLVMASMPTFDPNLFAAGIDSKTYHDLQASPDIPLYNRALQGRYPPGSTLKPFIGLAGLENNSAKVEGATFCPGWYTLKGDSHRYRDWKKEGHGYMTLDSAITQSCDIYFYDLALDLGIDKMHDILSRFGFGARTDIDMVSETSGLIPSRDWKRRARHQPWFPGETLITGIGQGYTLVTPIQLATAVSTMAMKGQRMQPRLVYAFQDSASSSISLLEPVKKEPIKLSNPAYWDQIIAAMTNVVHGPHGTAQGISRNLPFKIAGKTGTAQVFGIKQNEKYNANQISERLRDHALFISFAPADDPRIAIAVVVENGEHGASTAAPVARKLIEAYLINNTPPVPQNGVKP